MKRFLSAISGIIRDDSPISTARILSFIFSGVGAYMGIRMLNEGFSGMEIAAVLGACFSAAAGLKLYSKKYEASYHDRYQYRSTRDDGPDNNAL